LREYNFSINESKVKITRYPYDIDSINLDKELGSEYKGDKTDRFIRMIEKSNSFHSIGVKGSYKYVLKMLKSKSIPENEWPIVQAHLLSMMMVEPKLAQYISEIIRFNKNSIHEKTEIKNVVNKMISDNLKIGNEHEVLWLLWLSLKLDIKVNNIENIIDNADDLSIILALDIINKNKLLNNTTIRKVVSDLVSELNASDIHGERWLLIYTLISNTYSKDLALRKKIEKDGFLKKCLELGIKFYDNTMI